MKMDMGSISKSFLKSVFVWIGFGTLLLLCLGRLWLGAICIGSLMIIYYTFTFYRGSYLFGFFFFVGSVGINIIVFGAIYGSHGITEGIGGPSAEGMFNHIYFSVITLTTTGYGDFVPDEASRPYAATQAILGYVYMSLLMGMIGHFFARTADKYNVLREHPQKLTEDQELVSILCKEYGFWEGTAKAFIEYRGCCGYCDQDLYSNRSNYYSMQLDHLLPKSAFIQLATHSDNFVLSCLRCNNLKRDLSVLRDEEDPEYMLKSAKQDLIERVRLYLAPKIESDNYILSNLNTLVGWSDKK